MPRPNEQSSTHALTSTLHAIPDWFQTHRAALQAELGPSADHDAQAPALARSLDEAESAWVREQKEGKAVTTARDNLIEEIQRFVSSVKATAQRRLRAHPDRDKLLADVRASAPSLIRYPRQALKALNHLGSAASTHAAELDAQGMPVSADWQAKLQDLAQRLEIHAREAGREEREALRARQHRDKEKAKAADLLEDLDLAAQAVQHLDLAPLRELRVLFDTFHPQDTQGPAVEGDEDDLPQDPNA
jgi:hypothetical protein